MSIRLGIWRHYKGGLYLVTGIAQDTNDDSRQVVVYVSLMFETMSAGSSVMWVRTPDDFQAFVKLDEADGLARMTEDRVPGDALGYYVQERDDGFYGPRFEFLGETLTSAQIEQLARS